MISTKNLPQAALLSIGLLSDLALPKVSATESTNCQTNSLFNNLDGISLSNVIGGASCNINPQIGQRPPTFNYALLQVSNPTNQLNSFSTLVYGRDINELGGSLTNNNQFGIDISTEKMSSYTFRLGVYTNGISGFTNNPSTPDLFISKQFSAQELTNLVAGPIYDQLGTNYTVYKISFDLSSISQQLTSVTNPLLFSFNAITTTPSSSSIRIPATQAGSGYIAYSSATPQPTQRTNATPMISITTKECPQIERNFNVLYNLDAAGTFTASAASTNETLQYTLNLEEPINWIDTTTNQVAIPNVSQNQEPKKFFRVKP